MVRKLTLAKHRSKVGRKTKKRKSDIIQHHSFSDKPIFGSDLASEAERLVEALDVFNSQIYDAVWSALTESIVYDRPSEVNRDVTTVVEILHRAPDFSQSVVSSALREADIDDSEEILTQVGSVLVEYLSSLSKIETARERGGG